MGEYEFVFHLKAPVKCTVKLYDVILLFLTLWKYVYTMII